MAAMDRGPHILSLSGHGNPGWICSLSNGDWTGLTTRHTFITYASGCQTAWYEGEDVMGQIAVNNPTGAVAYVGTHGTLDRACRDAVAATFFRTLSSTQHLGLLHDARLQIITDGASPYDRWMVFVQTFSENPEMPVWTRAPRSFLVDISRIDQNLVRVKVRSEDEDVGPVGGAAIHVRQGDNAFAVLTDADGRAELELAPHGAAPFELTVSAQSFAPMRLTLLPTGPGWVSGTVRTVQAGQTEAGNQHAPPQITLELRRGADERPSPAKWAIPGRRP